MKRRQISLTARSAWSAQLFILPFYIGFLFFFLSPLIESLKMSFSLVSISGETIGYQMENVGLANYRVAFLEDVNYSTNLANTFSSLAWKAPSILFLSLFLALILNQKFKGRTLVRAIFFLPVIFASGVALKIISGDTVVANTVLGNVVQNGEVQGTSSLSSFLTNAGIGSEIIGIATQISNSLFSLVWRAGIQMIIFLAGLQSISPALYEASAIEGATAWENFWKITLPMLTPTIMINLVYTIIDNFTDSTNSIMMQVTNQFENSVTKYGIASAFAWIYFAFIALILLIVFIIFSRINKKLT